MTWLLRGNVSLRWAVMATLLAWGAIPLLWRINEWGVLSPAEVTWLLLVAAAWLLAVGGVRLAEQHGAAIAAAVFAWSSVLPTVLLLYALLLYAIDPGSGGQID